MDRVDYQSLIIQDLVNLHKNGDLDLSPWYQRRSVWTPPQKSYFINTLHERKPIPAIYIRHSLDLEKSKSIKEIVDGQQRTRSIISFWEDGFAARHPAYKKPVKFSQLKRDEQQKFLLTSIPIGYLLGATDADVIDIFGRINSISKPLNAQEKRNAAYSGEMKQFCLAQASSRLPFWRSYRIFSGNDISRMAEIQFTSDLVFNLLNGLSDFSSTKIDKMYKEFDDSFTRAGEIESRLDKIFDAVAAIPAAKISDTIFSRQPIFFSLLMVIDSITNINPKKLYESIVQIDSLFNSGNRADRNLIKFIDACTSTTQRITQRRVREEFIRRHM